MNCLFGLSVGLGFCLAGKICGRAGEEEGGAPAGLKTGTREFDEPLDSKQVQVPLRKQI